MKAIPIDETKTIYRRPNHRKILLPDIPEEKKCFFRKEYDAGKSLQQIALENHCDRRTVRIAIIHNRDEIGQQTVDSKTDKYKHRIERLLETIPKSRSLFSKSTQIAKTLNESGIEISERSIRNYIKEQENTQFSKENNL